MQFYPNNIDELKNENYILIILKFRIMFYGEFLKN